MALESIKKSEQPADDEKVLRPSRLGEFIGQTQLKSKLDISIQAALHRKESLDHILFSGPPGLGKTTLAGILSKEMGSGFHTTSAPAITKPGDLAKILTLLEEGDVFFIDEIHRLNRPCEEILYPAMEDGYIDFVVGEGVTARSIRIDLKPFTLVGATTRTGLLSSPLKDRFGIELKLEFYDKGELIEIVKRTASILDLNVDQKAAEIVAERSRMTPRIANRLVRRIRDYATVENVSLINGEYAGRCLDQWGVDDRGLVELDRRLLGLMIERYRGGPVGIRTLAALVDEDERTLEEDHEPFMLRIGFWEKTPQGRMVTASGYRHLGVDPPVEGEKQRHRDPAQRDLFSDE